MNFIDSGFQNLRFSVMSAELACAFCTQTSAGFSVKAGTFRGWVDVHFPCEGHIKVRIRGALPDDYLKGPAIKQFVSELLAQLKVKSDDTYEATFFKPTKVVEMGKSVNREAVTDRIEIARKHIPPD
ncbi:MAG: hypothetical protein WCL11_11510 [Verrucomicrobiota bacterium]